MSILAFAGAAAESAAYNVAGTAASMSITSSLTPALRPLTYAQNKGSPTLLPDPQQMLKIFYSGGMPEKTLKAWLGSHGIDINLGPYESQSARQWMWSKVVDLGRPDLGLDNLRTAFLRSTPQGDEFEKALARRGIAMNSPAATNYLFPPNVLPVGSLLDLRNRGKITALELEQFLTAIGYGQNSDRRLWDHLRYALPSANQIILYAVREVWDQATVDRFGTDEEFPEALRFWLEKQGYGWKPTDQFTDVPAGQDIPWPVAEWRAHWVPLSPFQAYQAFHRLRPISREESARRAARPGGLSPRERELAAEGKQSRVEGIRSFTEDDLKLALKIADYAPGTRETLEGISYNPLGRVDIRRMFRLGILSVEEVVELYRDLGYSPENAYRLARFTQAQEGRRQRARTIARGETKIRNAYSIGYIDQDRAALDLYRIRLTDPEALDQFNALTKSQQLERAKANPAVLSQIREVDLDRNNKYYASQLDVIREKFVTGRIDYNTAFRECETLGIGTIRCADHLSQWQADMELRAREVTTKQIRDWTLADILTIAEAENRLKNIGWLPGDIDLIMEDIRKVKEERNARDAMRRARSEDSLSRGVERLIEHGFRLLSEGVEAGRRALTPAAIQRMAKKGIIGPETALELLQDRGYSEEDASRLLRDAYTRTPNRTVAERAESEQAEEATPTHPEPPGE